MATGADFNIQLRQWSKVTQDKLQALARQTCQQISENVVNDTPVDTGFLRSAWQPSINQPEVEQGVPGKVHPRGLTTISGTVSKLKLGDRYFLLNGAVYGRRIEYGFVGQDSLGRTYNQKGRFFVTRNVKRARTVVKQIAQALKL